MSKPANAERRGVGQERIVGAPGEIVRVDDYVSARIKADHVVVGASGVLSGSVEAETVVVEGAVQGRVTAVNVDVEAGGSVDGEVHADVLRVQGVVVGIARAAKMLIRTNAVMTGFVISDRLGSEVDAVWRDVSIMAEPGRFMDKEALRYARAMIADRKASVEAPVAESDVGVEHPVEVPLVSEVPSVSEVMALAAAPEELVEPERTDLDYVDATAGADDFEEARTVPVLALRGRARIAAVRTVEDAPVAEPDVPQDRPSLHLVSDCELPPVEGGVAEPFWPQPFLIRSSFR